ncbi:transporter [Actinoplanes sp. NPDC048791]|uniref:transporter n=1 Tax=Actinoplanes sp. NPDC048791 TaxID=3154623 RepID=UPI0033FD9CB5
MDARDDELPPADPAESLRLIARERATTARRLTPDPRLLLWPWGLAWLIGFGVFFLRFGPDERVYVDMPDWVPLTVLLGLITLAGITTGFVGARASRQVSGPSSRQGAMYGFTWSVAFIGMAVLFSRISDLLPVPDANLLWAGAMVALTGALHMAGGALWNDRVLYVLGLSISVINVAGVIIGPGWHALIVAVFGGGGMLVAGLISWLRMPR